MDEPRGPVAGMTISLRTRRDVVVVDPDRFLAAARAAYRDLNPGLTDAEVAEAVADVTDAAYALIERHGDLVVDREPARHPLPGIRVPDRPDGLPPAGRVRELVVDEPKALQDYGCALGSYPTLAAHIEAAQISGLPGAYPAGAVLNRITNPTLKNQNGYKACPPSSVWPRPTGKSCDEYPFRSTSQGASTQTPQGTARTFAPPTVSWCEMNPAWGVPTGVTGPTGWSSCMINATHNGNGGAALGAFYSSNRVLDGDPFKVWIQP